MSYFLVVDRVVGLVVVVLAEGENVVTHNLPCIVGHYILSFS